MLIAGRPDFSAVNGMDFGVPPGDVCGSGLLATSPRALYELNASHLNSVDLGCRQQ
jgi:hypothetical protein